MKENIVYKGSERRVIIVKSASSKHFEEAHFFLRAEDGALAPMDDLLREANRIVEQSLLPPLHKKRRDSQRWFRTGFAVGSVFAGVLAAGIWLLTACF